MWHGLKTRCVFVYESLKRDNRKRKQVKEKGEVTRKN